MIIDSKSTSSRETESKQFFETTLISAETAGFLLIGDWGDDQNIEHVKKVADAMNIQATARNSSAVIALGDNFYAGGRYDYEGVKAIDDVKFETLWADIYNGSAIESLPWYVVLGNHDWYTNDSNTFEMLYDSSKWQIPDFFYTKRFQIQTSTSLFNASFIFIETDLLFYGYQQGSEAIPANFAKLGWSAANATVEKQLAWIDRALAEANNDQYVFLLGHHPTFTCVSHVLESVNMLSVLELVNKWKISAFVNGHQHSLAYYYTNDNNTLQIQSGAGGTSLALPCAPVNSSAPGKELAQTYGFSHLELSSSAAIFDFVDENSNTVFSASVSPRRPVDVKVNCEFLTSACDSSIHFKRALGDTCANIPAIDGFLCYSNDSAKNSEVLLAVSIGIICVSFVVWKI
ncbi:Tartrate-resistant acid phosphatase type 5 [Physocladia obscura]|uniref:Tartrate-resistant acid phosphatase type 5 n=1 Tax=Physocladia obscura TaxID=109957 RepID=A0AAD5T075_9FUNG|nr:Tartrate-resistant acid phosphatase type 5 [Physocladia obscura]